LTEDKETQVLMHSLREANMPKFLAEDVPLFESIMADLFPNIVLNPSSNPALEV
jgi:dynein heavy chain